MKRLFLLLSFLGGISMCNFSNAQDAKFWQTVESSELKSSNMRNWLPNQYQSAILNRDAIQHYLANAPMEYSIPVNQSPLIIELPMPNGEYQHFHLVESSIMESGLAAKYPTIKTYLGQGIEDKTAVMRCDLSVWGFHAFIRAAAGTIFISPYSQESDTEYISFYKHDLPQNPNQKEAQVDMNQMDISLLNVQKTLQIAPNQPQNPASAMRENGTGLRQYRLALAATEQYCGAFTNPTKASILAAIVTSVNRINTVFETDLAVRLVLVANTDTLIYLPTTTDPYDDSNESLVVQRNQTHTDSLIGSANYDIGSVFGRSMFAEFSVGSSVCDNQKKAKSMVYYSTVVGDEFDLDMVAICFGRQFGATETFNMNMNNCTNVWATRDMNSAYEPGLGSTIMAVAHLSGGGCGPTFQANSDAYFHAKSLDQIWNFITTGLGSVCATPNANQNQLPVLTINGNMSYAIPYKTPFKLSASATDADNDSLTYCWEQYDLGPAGGILSPVGNAPIFRSMLPKTTGIRIFPKMFNLLNPYLYNPDGEMLPKYARTMHFRCSVRDNRAGGGGVSFNDSLVVVDVINTVDSFAVSCFNTPYINILGGSYQTITWDIAQSNAAPINCQKVNILYSIDNAVTFQTLVANTDNDGSEVVVIPNIATTKARIIVEAADNIFFDVNNRMFRVLFLNTGIENSLSEGSVQIYPNPSTGLFNIETILEKDETVNLIVTNMLGQEIKADSFWHTEKYSLDLEGQPSGVYFVKVQTNTGSLVKRITKE